MKTSFWNETFDLVDTSLCVIDAYASRYQIDKKELLTMLIKELEKRL